MARALHGWRWIGLTSPRHRGVRPAEVVGQAPPRRRPACGQGGGGRRAARRRALPRLRYALSHSHTSSSPTWASSRTSRVRPRRWGRSAPGGHRQRERLSGIQPAVGGDAVLEVHQTGQRHGEVAPGHQRGLHREGQHPGVGLRQRVVDGVTGEPLVGREPGPVDRTSSTTRVRSGTVSPLGRAAVRAARTSSGAVDGIAASVSTATVRPRAGSGRRPARRCR